MKRRKTSADIFIDNLEKACPELLRLRAGVYSASSEEAEWAAAELFHKRGLFDDLTDIDYKKLLWLQSNDIGTIVPEDIALYSRWRTCRQVYDFDADLAMALKESEAPESMPLDALKLLPYPIQYIQAPLESSSLGGKVFDSPGFFAWTDTQNDINGTAHDVLFLFLVRKDRPCVRLSISLECDTVGAAVADLIQADMDLLDRFGSAGVIKQDSIYSFAKKTVTEALSLLLYLVSDNAEVDVIYKPSGNTKKNLSPSTIFSVGTRIGAALKAAKVRYVGREAGSADTGTVRTVATHVRSGHWHHHWHGARDSAERRLVPHWQAPTIVNPDGQSSDTTIIHKAKG